MNKIKTLKIGFILDLHGKVNNPISRLDNYMQSILDKVEVVLKQNHIIVFCGDIFNTYLTGTPFVNKLLLLLTRYESMGRIIKIIAGNHDLIGRNYNTLNETSLGTLTIGRDWLLTDTYSTKLFKIVPLTFWDDGTPYVPPELREDDCTNILVGHAYYNHPEFNDKWDISDEVMNNFHFCVLGHDHQEYPILETKNSTGCLLLRSGSISRVTIDDKDRELKYPQIVIKSVNGIWEEHDCSYIDLPYKPAEEVFKVVNANQEITKHRKNIQKMIDLLQIDTSKDKEYSLDEALKELECPKKYKDIIQEVLND